MILHSVQSACNALPPRDLKIVLFINLKSFHYGKSSLWRLGFSWIDLTIPKGNALYIIIFTAIPSNVPNNVEKRGSKDRSREDILYLMNVLTCQLSHLLSYHPYNKSSECLRCFSSVLSKSFLSTPNSILQKNSCIQSFSTVNTKQKSFQECVLYKVHKSVFPFI